MTTLFQIDAVRPLNWLRPFSWTTALCAALSWPGIVTAQTSNTVTPQANGSDQSVVLSGVVLNANTNQPVARALVQVGSKTVLTEHDGKFKFTAPAGTSEVVRVSKPGFYDGLDQNWVMKRFTFSADVGPVKVYLFPEGLITGTLTAPNGDPLPNIFVQTLRKTGDESGSSWNVAGQTSSNSDGQFRLALGAGDYVVETHYVPSQFVPHQVVMPAVAPDPANGSESAARPAIHLESGSEQHLDLRLQVRPTHEVHIRVDGAQGAPQSNLQIEAHLPNGLSFFPTSRPTGTPGDFIATMPTGSYLLTTYAGNGDGGSYAQSAITVGDVETASVVMHLASSLPIPVELTVDSSSTSASDNTPPNVQQLALHFVRTSQQAPQMDNQNIYLRSGRGESPTFSLLPGTYRLLARPMPRWFIASATVAGTDLLAHDLDVEAGQTSAPLRITVSSHTAGIKGTVKLDGNPTGNYWVYLVAATPGVVPIIPIVSSGDGSFSGPAIPPGSYRAVAFETRRSEDFTDPATLDRLASYMKSFTVAPGETASIDIDAVPTLESSH